MGIAKEYAEKQENKKFSAKAYAKKIDKYNSTDYSMVNQAYIDSFMKDANNYFKTAESDYGNVNWGNAASSYNTKNTAWNDLSSRADAVGAWLYHNRNSLNDDAYNYYNDYLDSIYEDGRGIVDSFKNYSDYFKQWTTQKDYDLWKADEDEYARVRALPGFSKYTDSKFQKNYEAQIGMDILGTKGAFVGSNAIGDRNVNIERIKKYLTPEDLAIYYYYLEKEPEKAEAYYNKISDQATYESAKSKSKLYNQTGVEWLNSVVAGVDSFSAGMQNVGNVVNGALWGTENEIIQPSVSQYAFNMMRQDNDGLWAIANDLAQTIGNQLPSMALNAAIPGAGLVTMGVSAAGNAYAEMKQIEGISETQAIAYGATIGVLEATLQKIMGGISGLGSDGGFVQKAVNKALPNITNGFARAIVSLGANMADEGIEEAAQTALEPIVQWITSGNIPSQFNSGEDFINHIGDIAYSGFLGALSAGVLEGGTDTINTLQLNSQYNKAYSNNPQALKALLESIAMENPDLDISKVQNRVDAGKNVSGNMIRELAYQNELANWNKDYNKVVSATESRLNELGEQGNVKKLAESIARAQFGDFGSAIENAENIVRGTKDANADTLAYAMADYRGDIKDLSRSDKRNIRHSEYGSRVSNELNPNMRDETSSTWAQGVKTNRLGKGAEGVAKTRVALTQLNEASKSQKKLPSNAISYKSGAVDASLTPKGRDAKIEGENKTVSETYARAEGYKGLANETFSKYYKGENIEEYALGFREAYDYGLNGTVKDVKDLANHGSFKSYINEEAREMAFNAGVVDAKYMGIKSKTIKVDGDYKVTVPMSNKALSESKQATIELMKVLAPIAKVNMSTMVSIKDHGLYDHKTNTIYIDLAMDGRDVMIFTLAHELTHHLKRVNPEQFDEFARALFEEVGKTENIEERLAKWMRENKKYYPNMDQTKFKALAREEVVAEMCESFLTDEKVVQRISQKVYETDKGLWNTIKKWFEDLVAKLKKLFADLDPQSENGRIVREMGDRLDAVRQMWADMVVEAGVVEKSGTSENVMHSHKDLEKLDTDYLSAVERGDMETAQRMVDEVANTTMPDSKIRTEDGKLRVVYHGTNAGDFTIFNPDYIGMSSGDDGFFGMGFYFAYSKGEASYYGSSRVIPAYLNLKNPFNFEKELQSYQGKRASGGYAPDAVAVMNFADKFPEIAKNVKIGVVENGSDTVKDITLVEFSKAFKDVIENKTFEYREVENEFGEKETVVTADAKTVEYQYDGKKYSYTDYGFQKRFWGTPNELDVAYEYLANSVYEYVDMIPRTRLILDNNREFTDALKDMGYDGTIQSEYGDEAVAFYPNQIKSADPVAYDDEGNVIPLSQRFNEENEDIRYSRKTVDPITSREALAKALSKVAKGEDRAIVESYKANVNLIKGETERLKALKESGKYIATVDGKKILEAEKRFRTKDDIDKLATLEHNYNATLKRISGYDKKLLQIEAMSSIKQLINREKKASYNKAKAEGREALKEYKAQAIAEQKKITERYQEMRKKNVEGRKTTEMRHKLMNTVHTLDQLLVNPTKKKHIPIGLQKPVAEALNILNTDTVGAEERLAKITAELKTTDNPVEIEQLLKRYNRIKAQGDKIKEKIDSLKTAYDKLLTSDDEIIRNSHDEVISNMIQNASEKIGDKAVRDMTYDELEMLYNMYRAILKTVRDTNKAFATAKEAEITTLADNVMSELETYERKNKAIPTGLDKALQLEWTNLKPTYAFERIGSSTFTELYNNIRHGEDIWAKDVNDARAFFDKQKKQYGFDKWDFKKKYAFTSKHGRNFELTLEQIMSIYAYTRRGDQAIEHLINGGFVFDKHTVSEKKSKSGITYEVVFDDPKAYSLSEGIIGQINATLTNEQMAFARAMQGYLSKTMGEKGNEVSRQLYDINIFGEENYFPLKTSEVYKERVREQARGEVKIKNKGFTKETTPHSTSPVVLTPFTDVWATHCIEMSMYHAFTLPLENFYRVYNYKERADIEGEEDGVTRRLEEAYGKAVTAYIDQLLVDVNGGTRGDPRASALDKGLATFKKAKVMGSLSVVIQQPSAIVRAIAYIDLKYFIDKPSKPNHKANWEELKKYAPVAIIKEMGKFDVGVGQSTVDWIKDNPTLRDKIDEVVSKAPAYADEMGWISIWKAVKREVAATTNLKINSEEFLQRCGERFTEVVSKTQLYDSVFARSGYMRSKDVGAKMFTAFMAEPTTTLNILEDAVMKAIRGNPKFMARAITSCLASSLINSALVSVVYAMRDDEDEEYWKKYLSTLGETAIDNINPLNMMPYIRDIWSMVQGYRVSRSDLTLWQEIIWDINRLAKNEFSEFEDWVNVITSISQVTGIPLKNLLRDARGIWNTAKSLIK